MHQCKEKGQKKRALRSEGGVSCGRGCIFPTLGAHAKGLREIFQPLGRQYGEPTGVKTLGEQSLGRREEKFSGRHAGGNDAHSKEGGREPGGAIFDVAKQRMEGRERQKQTQTAGRKRSFLGDSKRRETHLWRLEERISL